jgi:hypothetical protein
VNADGLKYSLDFNYFTPPDQSVFASRISLSPLAKLVSSWGSLAMIVQVCGGKEAERF